MDPKARGFCEIRSCSHNPSMIKFIAGGRLLKFSCGIPKAGIGDRVIPAMSGLQATPIPTLLLVPFFNKIPFLTSDFQYLTILYQHFGILGIYIIYELSLFFIKCKFILLIVTLTPPNYSMKLKKK